MANQSLMQIILQIIKDPRVIITMLSCLILMNFACYIAHYRKKPKFRRGKPNIAAAASKPKEPASNAGESSAGDDEDSSNGGETV